MSLFCSCVRKDEYFAVWVCRKYPGQHMIPATYRKTVFAADRIAILDVYLDILTNSIYFHTSTEVDFVESVLGLQSRSFGTLMDGFGL